MDKLFGYYNLEKSENFDEYMKRCGVGWALRTIGNTTKPSVEILKNNGDFSIKTYSTLKNTDIQFQLGKEIDEVTLDGRNVKTTFSLEGDKLVQTQKATKSGEKDSVITRQIVGDKLVTTCKIEEVEAVRTYSRGQK